VIYNKLLSLPVAIACSLFAFHSWATSLASGSSGFGSDLLKERI